MLSLRITEIKQCYTYTVVLLSSPSRRACLSPGQVFFASVNSPQGQKQGSLGRMPLDLLPGCLCSTCPFSSGATGPARLKAARPARGEAEGREVWGGAPNEFHFQVRAFPKTNSWSEEEC